MDTARKVGVVSWLKGPIAIHLQAEQPEFVWKPGALKEFPHLVIRHIDAGDIGINVQGAATALAGRDADANQQGGR